MARQASPFATYSRQINKHFADHSQFQGFKAQVSCVGSFIALRIDDPEGRMTVRMFDLVSRFAGSMLQKDGLVKTFQPIAANVWVYDGCVSNWERI